MTLELWKQVDTYLDGLLVPDDPALQSALADCEAAGLPPISVTPTQGKLLRMLAQMQSAQRILEIGTLGGYSTIWLARGLAPGGKLITLEYDPKHAEIARRNMARAGLSATVDIRIGKALDTLPQVEKDGLAPFDLIFIDADKVTYPEYFDWSLRLSRKGTLIIADNVVRDGGVIDPASKDPNIQGVRRFLELVAKENRVTATAVQTVSAKGYDGFALLRVEK